MNKIIEQNEILFKKFIPFQENNKILEIIKENNEEMLKQVLEKKRNDLKELNKVIDYLEEIRDRLDKEAMSLEEELYC